MGVYFYMLPVIRLFVRPLASGRLPATCTYLGGPLGSGSDFLPGLKDADADPRIGRASLKCDSLTIGVPRLIVVGSQPSHELPQALRYSQRISQHRRV